MCGIAGFLNTDCSDSEATGQALLRAMADAIKHRGPDDHGIEFHPGSGIGLAHRRLSILDLSPNGRQPMWSTGKRFCISFNGEIYNFRELSAQLQQQGCSFRGHSDTEVLLSAIETWGLDLALQRISGMFAFAVWDSRERVLHLARDRIGEKPLYYGEVGGRVVFASELKSLRCVPGWHGTIERQSLDQLMRYGYIPSPASIYEGIYKLLPGSVISIPAARNRLSSALNPHPDTAGISPRRYWSAEAVVDSGVHDRCTRSDSAAIEQLDTMLRSVVRQQMVADVPLGAFLSGGIDSTLVVSCMQAESAKPIRTFTIGYHERGFNEAEFALAISRHLGTEHHELYVTPAQAMDVIPSLPAIYDEPFADSSQIPTLLVCQLARRHVTVSLSGDGGDELFAGYNRYLWSDSLGRRARWMPSGLRALMATGLRSVPPAAWDALQDRIRRWAPRLGKSIPPNLGGKLQKLAEGLRAGSSMEIYRGLVSGWRGASLVHGLEHDGQKQFDAVLAGRPEGWPFMDQAMFFDLMQYLPDDNLVKVDRASMSVGLETRVPLLDPRVMEFAAQLPMNMKVRSGKGKWILRQVLNRYVPRELTERPKMGFSVPVGQWLAGPLREWAEDLLATPHLESEGFFDAQRVASCWQEHLAGRHHQTQSLWTVLMFQAWKRELARNTVH